MAVTRDSDRLGRAGGTPTRITIRNGRSVDSMVDILRIDDREAKKVLDSFFDHAKGQVKSFREEISKLGSEVTDSIESEKRELVDLDREREKEHRRELSRIENEYNERVKKARRSADELSRIEKKHVEDIRTENERSERERLKSVRRRYELEKRYIEETREQTRILDKYEGTEIGDKLTSIFEDINSKAGKLSSLESRITVDMDDSALADIAEQALKLKDEIKSLRDKADDLVDAVEDEQRRREEETERYEQRAKDRSEMMKTAFKQFLHSAVTILTHNLTDGIQKYFNTYENTFTEFAGRMQTSYNDTRSFYHAIREDLYNQGMQSALNLSDDLIPAVQTAVQQGFTGNDAIAKGMADAQSKIIMPWLDTASDAWVNMSFNMSKQNMEILKSQQLQLQQTKSGNRLLQSGVINSLTNELEPLLRNIDFNTGGVNNLPAEAQAMMAALVESGMTAQEAYAQVSDAIKAQGNQFDYLANGTVKQKLLAMSADQGIFSQFDNLSYISNMAANSGSNLNASAINSILGMGWTVGTTEYAREFADAIDKKGMFITSSSNSKWNNTVDNINEYITATKGFQNRQQNLSSIAGEWITAIPEGDRWFTAILDLLKGIIAAIVGGSLIDKLVDVLGGTGEGAGLLSRGFGSKLLSGGKKLLSGIKTVGSKILSFLGGGSVGLGVATVGATALGAYVAIDNGKKLAKEINNMNDPRLSTAERNRERDAAVGHGAATALGAGGALVAIGAGIAGTGVGVAAGAIIAGIGLIVGLVTDSNKEQVKISKVVKQVDNKYEEQLEIMKQQKTESKEVLDGIAAEIASASSKEEMEDLMIKNGYMREDERGTLSRLAMQERVSEIDKYSNAVSNNSGFEFDLSRGKVKDVADDRAWHNDALILEDIKNSDEYKEYDRTGVVTDALKRRLKDAGYDISVLGEPRKRGLFGSTWGFLGGDDREQDIDWILNNQTPRHSMTSGMYSDYGEVYGLDLFNTDPPTDLISEAYKAAEIIKQYNKLSEGAKSAPAIQTSYDGAVDFINTNRNELANWGVDVDKLTDPAFSNMYPMAYNVLYNKEFEPIGYAIGSPYITKDQYAELHKGERVLTSRQNEVFNAVGSTGLLLMGNSLISKLIGNWNQGSSDNEDNDISREDMTDTIVSGLTKIREAITELGNRNGINYETRTLPRMTNNYNESLVNLSPVISSK